MTETVSLDSMGTPRPTWALSLSWTHHGQHHDCQQDSVDSFLLSTFLNHLSVVLGFGREPLALLAYRHRTLARVAME